MNSQVCVNCNNKKPVNSTTNRLVTESCGHVKCMDCLLQETAGCAACLRDGSDQEIGDVQTPEEEMEEPATAYEAPVEIPETAKENQTEIEDINKKVKPETTHIRIEIDGNTRYFICTLCKKKFHARSQVAYHAYCNGQRKPYQCPDCNKSFAVLSHFKYHMSVHRNERTYSCEVCTESFFQMSKLQRHKLKHTKEKKHACGQCSKAFNNVSALRKHGLTHTEERPYACIVCAHRFRDSSNFRKHLNKHEETDFACTVCGTKMESRRGLAEHVKSEHGMVLSQLRPLESRPRRPHQCPRCPQAFHSGKDMRRHAAVHSDSKPFRCKVCNRRFRRKDNLERHIRNTHPNCDTSTVVECDESALKLIANRQAQEKKSTDESYQNAEKAKLEILNPLPPLPEEVIQKHLNLTTEAKDAKEVNENISQNNQEEVTFIDKSYILEANNARESVIVGKWNASMDRKEASPVPEYVHKIRRANSIACRKDGLLPPIDERKLMELETKNNLNNLDVGAPVKNMEIYKKILYERIDKDTSVSNDDDSKVHQTSPKLYWRRKLKLNINW